MMVQSFLKSVVFISLFLGIVHKPLGQSLSPLEHYKESIPMTPEIFNGGEYVEYPSSFIGHAFYQTSSYTYADIVYNGIAYRGIPLLYDLVSQNLVVLNPTHAKKVMIQSNKVAEFTMNMSTGSVRFVKGEVLGVEGEFKNEFVEEIVPKGFYAFHQKSLQREIKDLDRNTRFDQSENFLLLYEEELILVKGKNRIIQILEMDKKSTRRTLKEKGLKYRLDRRAYHSAILQIYQNQIKDE